MILILLPIIIVLMIFVIAMIKRGKKIFATILLVAVLIIIGFLLNIFLNQSQSRIDISNQLEYQMMHGLDSIN